MRKGPSRYPQAYRSLRRLRFTDLQSARDMYYIHAQLVEENKIIKGDNFFKRFAELFTVPRNRRAALAAHTVMLGQQSEYHRLVVDLSRS
jgi:hypothetical protein